jgi:F-type H+-transporting ATPase subunit b
MLEIDWTLPIVTAMFLVFAVLMNQVFFKPVTRVLAARQDHIKQMHEAAQAALAEAKGLQADYATRLSVAQGQAQEAIQAALKESEGRRQALLESVKDEVAKDVDSARASIQAERDAAIAALNNEVGAFSDTIKRKVLGGAPALSTGGHE